jgi:hypothetical protein
MSYSAAWVPDEDGRDWEVAAGLAVAWVEEECGQQQAVGALVTNVLGVESSIPSLAAFARRHQHTTPRAGRDRVGRGKGPVLAYVPDERALAFAMILARGSSLCAVEGSLFPLHGWAIETGAVDLTRLGREPRSHDPRVAEAVERLCFYGNNGYGPQFDRQQAERIVSDLCRQGLLERDEVLGAVMARGVSAGGVKRLGALIDSLSRA